MRKAAVWILVAGVVLTSVFAALGSTTVFAVYAVALGVTGWLHWSRGCAMCTNTACAINPRSPECVFGTRRGAVATPEGEEFSDLDSARLGIPVVLALLVGLYGVWTFSPLALAATVLVIAAGFALYSCVSCTGCTNDCPGNRNPAYHEWKSSS